MIGSIFIQAHMFVTTYGKNFFTIEFQDMSFIHRTLSCASICSPRGLFAKNSFVLFALKPTLLPCVILLIVKITVDCI